MKKCYLLFFLFTSSLHAEGVRNYSLMFASVPLLSLIAGIVVTSLFSEDPYEVSCFTKNDKMFKTGALPPLMQNNFLFHPPEEKNSFNKFLLANHENQISFYSSNRK